MDLRGLIDWSVAWFEPVRARGSTIETLSGLVDALAAHGSPGCNAYGLPVRFIPQAALPAGRAYEAHIAATGEVPTRENLHDLFNALAWFAWPRTKAALNARQAGVIARDGIGPTRGAARDAATLFDENALLLVTDDESLVAALRNHAWAELFDARRHCWHRSLRPIVFGHALMGKLVRPWKGVTAHAWHVALPVDAGMDCIDAAIAAAIVAGEPGSEFSPRCFLPLPVLGIPGWWSANTQAGFYFDATVFRPARAGPIPLE